MLEAVVLILLILILIFIMYTYYFSLEKEYKVINRNTVNTNITKNDKSILYTSDFLNISNNNVYIIYYDLPINSIYWTIGIYDNNSCLHNVNMGKYQTIERGDTLAVIIGKNNRAILAAKNEIEKEHIKNYLYKKLITHKIGVNDNFYIHFQSYANKFTVIPKLKIKEYVFENIDYYDFTNKTIEKSYYRECESYKLFNKAKSKFIEDNFQKVNILVDSDEKYVSNECLTCRSDEFINNSEFRIIAVDHFKSKAALHSHLKFYNTENNEQFRLEITGELSDKINNNNTITIRKIQFKVPDNIKSFYVVEYIYYDFVTGDKVNKDTIIPFEMYKIK